MKNNSSRFFFLRKASAGFTLIELMIAMVLTTIVVGITGFAVVAIADKNKTAKAETERRIEINRAQDFISDEVRMAIKVNSSATEWAWIDLGEDSSDNSPSAKLFLQIPINIDKVSVDATNNQLNVKKHGFSAGNAVRFTGSGIATTGLSPNVNYYVTKDPTTDSFKVSTSLEDAKTGKEFDLNAVGTGSLIANRLLIYYIRDNTSTWLGPKTINRSAGPCSYDNEETNCPVLADSIAADGFVATVIAPQKVKLDLRGALSDNSSKSLQTSNNSFARLFNILGGADKEKDLEDQLNKDNAIKAVDDANKKADDAKKKADDAIDAAKKAKKQADDAAKDYNDYKENTLKQLDNAAKVSVEKAAANSTSDAYNNAKVATDLYADAEYVAAKKADIAQQKAQEAIEAYNKAAEAATNYSTAEKSAAKVDLQKADDHTKSEIEAAKNAEEYTNIAKTITQYNGSTHTVAAKTADDKAVKYETTAAKYTTAEQAAKAYDDAKKTANQLAQAAETAAQQAIVQKSPAAHTAAAQANTNYATSEKAAAEKATAAQATLNEAVTYATGTQAATQYTAAPHLAAAQAAEQKAVAAHAAAAAQAAADLANAQRITTNNGTVTFTQASKLFVEVLGGSITCGSPGPEIPTTTTLNITNMSPMTLPSSTKSLTISVPAGSKLTVTGAAKGNSSSGSCKNFSSSYNSATNAITGSNSTNPPQQVWTLRNGQTPPAFKPYGAQRPIDAFLTKYLDPITGKISIRANQVIFLYELGATDKNIDAYDMQDLVVLATVSAN